MPPAGSRWGGIKLDRELHPLAILLSPGCTVVLAALGPLHMLSPPPLLKSTSFGLRPVHYSDLTLDIT